MSEDVYTRLREFMDTLPTGFPATPNGVEIKILKKLFTPEEAELTMKLSKEPEEVREIAAAALADHCPSGRCDTFVSAIRRTLRGCTLRMSRSEVAAR